MAFSLFVAGLGALGVCDPTRLITFARKFQTPAGLYVAAASRLIFGAALFLAAPESRAPVAIRVAGVVVFAAGLALPWIGRERLWRMFDWWAAHGANAMRALGAVVLVGGLALSYALLPALRSG